MTHPDPELLPSESLIAQLTPLLGSEHVLREAEQRARFSADIFRQGELAELVIAPGTVEELCAAVRACTRAGRYVTPRGGGFSYTSGYIPVRANTVVVDLRRLNRIVEINTDDMYVIVECGCTWHQVYEALHARGVRTPYFGPISGFASTVGGALSQGSFFMGSTQYGTTAESTLGLEVVLADGTLLRTGSGATPHASSPFFRTYGPDLTGVFLGDTGALGFKARAILKLIPFPEHHRYATYAFADDASVLSAMTRIARLGLAADCYAWDPYVVKNFATSTVNVKQGLGYLLGVIRSGSTWFSGIKDALRIALAGHRFVSGREYLMHATIDETSDAAAEVKFQQLKAVAEAAGGVATEPSIPRALRGTPFSYPNKILGSGGERWVPSHCLVPHSRANATHQAIRDYLASQQALIDEHQIQWGVLFFAVGNNTMCVEPLFYWPDARLPSHHQLMQPSYHDVLPHQPPNPAATAAMQQIRAGLTRMYASMGCAHVQIGKTYLYKESRDPATYQLLEAIKTAVDVEQRVNPGSLGLGLS